MQKAKKVIRVLLCSALAVWGVYAFGAYGVETGFTLLLCIIFPATYFVLPNTRRVARARWVVAYCLLFLFLFVNWVAAIVLAIGLPLVSGLYVLMVVKGPGSIFNNRYLD